MQKKRFECRPRPAKRVRTLQQPPQQAIHQSDLVLTFKILLTHRETPKPRQQAPMTERKISPDTTASPTETPSTNGLSKAEHLMVQALKQLQEIYNASCKTKANKIKIE